MYEDNANNTMEEIMTQIITFFTVLAWAGAVIGFLMLAVAMYSNATYENSIQRTIDRMNRVTRSWPTGRWFLLALVSVAFLYSTW
jgi:hypothetical protein